MRYLYYEDKYFNGLLNLWNEEAEIRGFYKPFTPESFRAHVINHPDFADSASFIALDGEEVVGFVCGIVKKADITDLSKPGYLTAILVKSTHRRRGIGAKLLEMCELDLRRKGRKAIRVVFLSNMNWPWYIPDTDKHDHPGAPAVPVNSPEYFFLLHHKFDVQGFCDAFHLPLDKYETPSDVYEKMKANSEKGFSIDLYDPNVHYGLDEFCANIQNEAFERAIRYNLSLERPNPFLVVSQRGKIVGWTGAMYTEPSGRAHFDGIATDPNVRGVGLGKALFCTLCQYSKEHGSKFMTFFTGLDNLARNIYLYAGFKIVQTFAIMKKELK